jgi:hypothetical protein
VALGLGGAAVAALVLLAEAHALARTERINSGVVSMTVRYLAEFMPASLPAAEPFMRPKTETVSSMLFWHMRGGPAL